MDFWNKVPFLRLVVPFILGVVFEINKWVSIEIVLPTLLISVAIMLILSLYPFKSNFLKRPLYSGRLALFITLLAGFTYAWFNRSINYNTHFSKLAATQEITVVGTIYEPPQEKRRSVKVFLELEEFSGGEKQEGCIGNLLVYFQKTEDALGLRYGDKVSIRCFPNEIKPPDNPRQFNFRQYLHNNDVYHQAYAKSESWKKIDSGQGHPIKQLAYRFREDMLEILNESISDNKNLAIGAALILGYKDHLDPDILRSFSSAGAMHVLAVSGLHVGIIFLFFNSLLKFLDKKKRYGKLIKVGLILIILWSYAFITGLSPSVMRAATMFSAVVIGQSLNRPTNIFNTLSASAFLLILFDPHIITKVGFQLSYLAVIGIVYLQPKLYALLYFKNWLVDKVWAITCVSFAAQLATFPLGLYYFHQFPNYFFISNLIVIPMATIILYTGILVLITHPLGLDGLFKWLLNHELTFLNKAVVFVEEIPYSLIYGNHIQVHEVLLLYLTVGLILAWFYFRKVYLVFSIAGLVTVLLLISSLGRYSNSTQHQMIVYKVPDKSVLNFIGGRYNFLLADEDFISDENQQLYYVKHNWFSLGHIKADQYQIDQNINTAGLAKYENLLSVHGKQILLMDTVFNVSALKSPIQVDYAILSGDQFFDIEAIENGVEASMFILDSSVPNKTSKIVEKLMKKRGMNVYNVNEEGAFVTNL